MPDRKKLIIGNWKMNLNVHESSLYLDKLEKNVQSHRDVDVVVAPTMLALQTMSLQVNRRKFKLAAQNFFWRDFGSYTGEVSATQLRGIVDYGIIGHSERRHIFHETSKDTRQKVQAALRNRMTPVLCIGETAEERARGETYDVLHDQLVAGLANVTSDEISRIILAYEPVWAIGTGDNATTADVAEAIKAIRSQIKHLYGLKASNEVHILYGGSVTSSSAPDYLKTAGVDGLLIGGASIKVHEFTKIIQQAHEAA